jgi:dihydrofolate reductase
MNGRLLIMRPEEEPMDQRPARRVRYQVAASLDGFIAGPNGEADWIVMDPDIDFAAHFAQFDTLLMGRKTFQALGPGSSSSGGAFGLRTLVFSRTLAAADHPGATIVADNPADAVRALKKEPGKDIWLFGGGGLFRSLAELGVVDRVEVAVIPVLLGGGLPLVPPGPKQLQLQLDGHRIYPKSGIVMLEYALRS